MKLSIKLLSILFCAIGSANITFAASTATGTVSTGTTTAINTSVDVTTPKDGFSPACPESNIFEKGRLFTDICWECILPIKVAGMTVTPGDAPPEEVTDAVCSCTDDLGVPLPGFMTGMWEPSRIISITKIPGCFPTMPFFNGLFSDIRQVGDGSYTTSTMDVDNVGFMHTHVVSFPLLKLANVVIDTMCNSGEYPDVGIMFLSEFYPIWANDELAFYTHPETVAVANPLALMACSADAIASTADYPIDSLWWCAGTWGGLYPISGKFNKTGSFAENTSHLAARALALMHRIGYERKTMGNASICDAELYPMLPKSQYKMSFIFPVPEADSSHKIGEFDLTWAAGRFIPYLGEDASYMLFRWNDCCVTF